MRPAEVDLTTLRILTALERTGSITAAADEVGLTQQAASRRLASAERTWGVALLRRGPRGSALTEQGRQAADLAEDVVRAADRLTRAVDALARPHATLRVAASLTIAEHLLPAWVLRLRAAEAADGQPPSAVEITAVNSATAIARAREGACDLALVETSELPEDLAVRTLWQDELVLVVGAAHPWASTTRPVPLEDLAATPLVVREEGSGTRRSLQDALARAGHEPVAPAAELATTAAVRAAVQAGLAPAVLSHLAVDDDLRLGRLVRVPLARRLTRPLSAVHAGNPSAGARHLLDVAGAG